MGRYAYPALGKDLQAVSQSLGAVVRMAMVPFRPFGAHLHGSCGGQGFTIEPGEAVSIVGVSGASEAPC